MYKEFFGLDDTPFTLTPDPRFIVFTPSYNEVLGEPLLRARERQRA